MLIVGLRTRDPHLNSETHRQISVPATPRKTRITSCAGLAAPLPRAQQQRKRASGCVLISLLGIHRSEEPEGARETREPGADPLASDRQRQRPSKYLAHAMSEAQCLLRRRLALPRRRRTCSEGQAKSSHDVCAVRQPLAVVPILRTPSQGCPGPGHSTPPSWPSCTAPCRAQQQPRAKGAWAVCGQHGTGNRKSPTLPGRAPLRPLAHQRTQTQPRVSSRADRRRPTWQASLPPVRGTTPASHCLSHAMQLVKLPSCHQ